MAAKKKSVKQEQPTIEQMRGKVSNFASIVAKLKSGEIKGRKVKPTNKDRLNVIKNQLLELKDANISYAILRHHIKETFGLNISEAGLRIYCQKELGFPTTKKKSIA
jgi:hypothetical protein